MKCRRRIRAVIPTNPIDLKPERKNLLQLNTAVLLWGGTALFSKTISLPLDHTICARSVIAALALLGFMCCSEIRLRFHTWRNLGILVFSGVLLAAHWLTYFHSMRLSTVAIGIIALHTYPVMTALLEPFFFKEPYRAADALLTGVVFIGILVLLPSFELSNQTTQGILWGILSALFFTVRNLLNRKYIRSFASSTLMFYQTGITALVLLPVALSHPAPYSESDVIQVIVLGAVFTALPHTLYTASFRHLKAKTVGVIASLLPVYGTLTAALILHETPSLRTVIGGTIVLLAVVYETWIHLK